jgi:hypothetical protein
LHDDDFPEPPTPGVFACVVDADERFHLEALRWWATLRHVVEVDACDVIVHAVGGCSSDVLDYLRGRGVSILEVELFDGRSPHCNKISGALRLGALHQVEGTVVLTDTDVVVLEDPRRLLVDPSAVASRIVGGPFPPLQLLESVFEAARVRLPELVPVQRYPGEMTVAGNGNGGLYLVAGESVRLMAEGWARWARWLLDHRDLMGEAATHVDQVAMALALAEGGLRPQLLDLRWNFPSQNRRRIAADAPAPAVLHYHRAVDEQGRLEATGIASVDSQIELANAAIALEWGEVFPRRRRAGSWRRRSRQAT